MSDFLTVGQLKNALKDCGDDEWVFLVVQELEEHRIRRYDAWAYDIGVHLNKSGQRDITIFGSTDPIIQDLRKRK